MMKKIVLLIEENYVKENAFLLKQNEEQFMLRRILLALFTAVMMGSIYVIMQDMLFMVLGAIGVIATYEYPILQMKNYKKKQQKEINAVFPQWVMQLETLVMANTIPIAIQKSYAVCPTILKEEVRQLAEKVIADPIDKKAYLHFLRSYQTADIVEVMLSLYQYNFSTKENMAYDFQILHKRLDALQCEARKKAQEEKSFFYGLLLIIEPSLACLWIMLVCMRLSDLIMELI